MEVIGEYASYLWIYITQILSCIPKFFYFIYTCATSVIDFIQYLFRAFAGLDVIYVEGKAFEGDLLYHFFVSIIDGTYPALQAVFWSVIILALIILFLSTLLAIFKSETNIKIEDKKGDKKVGNIKGKIIEKACMSIVWMVAIPVICIFGTYIGNIVLKGVDGATTANATDSILQSVKVNADGDLKNASDAFERDNKTSSYSNYDFFGSQISCSNTTFSGLAFKVVAYDANRMRTTEGFAETVIYAEETSADRTGHFGIFNQITDEAQCAIIIDEAFANNAIINKNSPYSGKKLDKDKGVSAKYCGGVTDFMCNYNREITSFSKYNLGLVNYYYDLWKFNFLIAYGFIILLFPTFYKIVFGLIKRLFILVALFLIAPAMLAFEPLASSSFFGPWKKKFFAYYVTVYAAVAGMNVFMSIQPYFTRISFFPPNIPGLDFLNMIVSLIIILVGISFINDFIEMVNEILGGERGGLVGMGADAVNKALDTGVKSVKAIGAIGKGAGKVIGSAAGLAGRGIGAGVNAIWGREARMNRAENRMNKAINRMPKDEEKIVSKYTDPDSKFAKGTEALLDGAYKGEKYKYVRDNLREEYETAIKNGTINKDEMTFKQWSEQKDIKEKAKNLESDFDKEYKIGGSDINTRVNARYSEIIEERRKLAEQNIEREKNELLDRNIKLEEEYRARRREYEESEEEKRNKHLLEEIKNGKYDDLVNNATTEEEKANLARLKRINDEKVRKKEERKKIRDAVMNNGIVKGSGDILKAFTGMFGIGGDDKKGK